MQGGSGRVDKYHYLLDFTKDEYGITGNKKRHRRN
jgi:hypothetical protein